MLVWQVALPICEVSRSFTPHASCAGHFFIWTATSRLPPLIQNRKHDPHEAFRLEFINGDQLGSPEWACVAFGGERETKRVLASPKSIEPSIPVEIGPRGRIVYYDEGKKLFQKDSIGKGAERGLLTMFTSLFESNQHATGSFSNGKAEVKKADVSLMLHFTRPGFDKCFMGSGATRDGFLSRCCVVSDYGNELTGESKQFSKRRS